MSALPHELPPSTYCPACGYDLCGLRGAEVNCPECGDKHAASALLDPRTSAERVRAIRRAITILVAFLWALSLAGAGAALAGIRQIAALLFAELALFGFLFARYGVLNLQSALARQLDRRLVFVAALLLFLRQLAWFGLPGVALLALLSEFPYMRSRFWAYFGLFLFSAGAALYDALTFGVIPERRTQYHRILNHLKHRAGDRSIPSDESK